MYIYAKDVTNHSITKNNHTFCLSMLGKCELLPTSSKILKYHFSCTNFYSYSQKSLYRTTLQGNKQYSPVLKFLNATIVSMTTFTYYHPPLKISLNLNFHICQYVIVCLSKNKMKSSSDKIDYFHKYILITISTLVCME